MSDANKPEDGDGRGYDDMPLALSDDDEFERAFPPMASAEIIVKTYGHPNWTPTGLERMALIVARAYLAPHLTHNEAREAALRIVETVDSKGEVNNLKPGDLGIVARAYLSLSPTGEDG